MANLQGTQTVDLRDMLIRSSVGMPPYALDPVTKEEFTAGLFYGYKNANAGPGDSAFADAKAWADAHNTPLVVVFDTGNGQYSTMFTTDLNDDMDYSGGRYFVQWMNKNAAGAKNYNCMFTYFKGSTTYPAACKEAYEFCRDICVENNVAVTFPLVACYWKWPDGKTVRTAASSNLTGVESLKSLVNNFLTKNKPSSQDNGKGNSMANTDVNPVAYAVNSSTAQTIASLILVQRTSSWSIDTSSGRFLGYKNPSTGFADAFQILKDYADTRNLPIAIVWANHGSSAANAIVDDINDGSDYTGDRYTLQLLNQLGAAYGTPAGKGNRLDIPAQSGYGFRAGWFQGAVATAGDCSSARQFCIEQGCSQSLDIMVALYWKYPDGTVYSKVNTVNFTTEPKLMQFIVGWLNANTYDQHKDKRPDTFFTVDFVDYDGRELIPQQSVIQGGSAVPPSQNPSRKGYIFVGYSESFANVQQNLTCIAQYTEDGSVGGEYFAKHTYAPGSYQMKISDNLCAIQVVGDMEENGMKSQLTSVTFQKNLFQVMPSCFMNCERLEQVDVTGQTKWIGDYAFYGCKNLTHINALMYPKQTQVNIIGAHAFQGTGLTDIAIDLTASYYNTGIGECAFADCTKLKSVRLTNSAYLGQAAFQGCTALTSVTLPNKSSYAYPETFSGCTSLSSIAIPPKVWMLNDGMFRNCTSLTSIDLQDYADNKSQLDRLGSEVFDGCGRLSSLTIPSSITSLMQIDENFLSGSSIRKITFNGLSDDVFISKYTEHHDFKTVDGYVTTLAQAKTVIKDALARNIPMVLITCKKSVKEDKTSDCPTCQKLSKMLTNKAWLNYMNVNKGKCYFIVGSFQDSNSLWELITDPGTKNNPLKGVYSNSSTLYAKLFAVYKDSKGKTSIEKWLGTDNVSKLIQQVDKVVSKASGKTIDEVSLSVMVSKFGSPRNYVLAYSSTGKEYKLSSNSQIKKYVAPEVDMVTTSGFKTGVWYYNASELKQYADDNRIPAFVEFSDYGCTPCTKFRTEIYERSEFQEWVAKQPYLFCRIETKNFGEFDRMFTQPYFVRHTWAKGGAVGLPCFIFYWNREQNPVWDMFGYHDNQIDYQELIDMITQKFKQ